MISVNRKQAGANSVPAPRRRGSLDQVLIDAAMDLFASYGYRGTSLSRIARAAGVTKGALYWHFSDKEEFFLAVVNKVLGESTAAPPGYKPAANRNEFVHEFLAMFKGMAVFNEKSPWVSRLLLIITLESHKISPRVLRAMRRRNLAQRRGIQNLIERGIALGCLDPSLDPQWAATEIFASYLGLAHLWYLQGPGHDLRKALIRQGNDYLRQWSVVT